jgi:hypothetical protein
MNNDYRTVDPKIILVNKSSMFIMKNSGYSRNAMKLWGSTKSRPMTSLSLRKSIGKYQQLHKSSKPDFKLDRTPPETNVRFTKSSQRYQSYAAYR